eukprot:3937940-Rhodomonas_salina.3
MVSAICEHNRMRSPCKECEEERSVSTTVKQQYARSAGIDLCTAGKENTARSARDRREETGTGRNTHILIVGVGGVK